MTPPAWDCPAGIWRMLMWPDKQYRRPRAAMQGATKGHDNSHFARWLKRIRTVIRATARTPRLFGRGQTFTPSKNNGKPSCAGLRLIHSMAPLPQAYFKALFMQGRKMQPPRHAYGCVPHRSREEAITAKMVLAWRLKAAGIIAAQVYYGMANDIEHLLANDAMGYLLAPAQPWGPR